MKQAKLFEIAPDWLSKRRKITAFKNAHGIVTHRTPFSREELPWCACLINEARKLGYGVKPDSDVFDCISKVGRLMEELGILVCAEGELSAIRLLCEQNGIPCNL